MVLLITVMGYQVTISVVISVTEIGRQVELMGLLLFVENLMQYIAKIY